MTICCPESARHALARRWRGVQVRAVLLAVIVALGAPGAGAAECPPLARGGAAAFGEIVHERGLLWRLTAPNGAESVLLGTMHVADPRVLAIVEPARVYLERARVYVMEVALDFAAMAELQNAMFYGAGRSLRETAGEALFTRVAAAMRTYGMDENLVARMKPWAAFTTLSLPAERAGVALDLTLMHAAQAAGTPVQGLETVAEQVAVFEHIGEAEQLELLREIACHHAVFQAEIEQMVERYAARDLAGLVDIAFGHATLHSSALIDALLWRRNERMLARLDQTLMRGDAFVAVGALHLPGRRGLLQGLARRGFVLEAIY